MSAFELLCGIAVLAIFLYYYLTSTHDFWKKRGVKGPKPELLTGNFGPVFKGKLPIAETLQRIYHKFSSEPVVGIFVRRTPTLVIRDLDLIKDVLIKDFSVFAERGLKIHEKMEPMTVHLFALDAKRWRPLRTRLSPVFTSGKMKEMFYLMLECGDAYEKYLDVVVSRNEPSDVRELAAKFTTDVIGSCAFGLNLKAIGDEDSEFRKMGRSIFEMNLKNFLKFILRDIPDFLFNIIGPFLMDKKLDDFFINSIKQTIEHRRQNKFVRHDFIDALIDLQDHPEKLPGIEVTDELLTAQAFIFFAAGFETSSSTISNALYELALNSSIQDKVREEIKESIKRNEGKLTYDSIKGMHYLDKVFKETLRMYPAAPTLIRKSLTDYTFESINVTIPAKTTVQIPIYAIQRDPAIYPDPAVFDPERFSEENVKARNPFAWLPFGDGSRNCIGARFAVYQTKLGLIKTLLNHKVEVCERTTIPYKNNPRAFLLAPIDGIFLRVQKLND